MSDNLLSQFTEKIMTELGYEADDFAARLIYEELDHNFYIYRLLWWEFGPNKALEIYRPIISAMTSGMPTNVAEAMGIDEVKDIPTLGKMLEAGMTAFPVLYETVINTEDLHVGRVPWCPNTFYSPAAEHEMEMHSYFRSQVAITIDPLMTNFVKYAYDHGMDFEVEVDCPMARCTDANARFCEYVVRKKGSPEYTPAVMPPDEEAYVEFDMGGEEPLMYCLRKQGRSAAEQMPLNLLSLVLLDVGAYEALARILGKDTSLELYHKLWASRAEKWTREARLELEIGKVSGLEDLARLVAYNQRRRFTPYEIEFQDDGRIILTGKSDPFVALGAGVLGKEIGDAYFRAVASGSQQLVDQVLREVDMDAKARATLTKSMARDDSTNEFTIETV
jgi:hypothetical protein